MVHLNYSNIEIASTSIKLWSYHAIDRIGQNVISLESSSADVEMFNWE